MRVSKIPLDHARLENNRIRSNRMHQREVMSDTWYADDDGGRNRRDLSQGAKYFKAVHLSNQRCCNKFLKEEIVVVYCTCGRAESSSEGTGKRV